MQRLAHSVRVGCALVVTTSIAMAHAAAAQSGQETEAHGTERTESTQGTEGTANTIGEVTIRSKQLFDPSDPAENNFLYRLANRLHMSTRESAIRAQLLFRPGDPYDPHQIAETERNLRAMRFLREPVIRPVRFHDGVVDLEVRTQDVWTMSPGVSFGRAGGANHTRLEFEDSNFLGRGKFFEAGIGSDVDRTSRTLEWRDPSVFGTHWQSGLRVADSTDGGGFELGLARPFYSLDTHWSAGFSALSDESVDHRYSLGEIVDGYERNQSEFDLHAGWSTGLHSGWVRRWVAGLHYDDARFAVSPLAPAPQVLPGDRRLSYPYVSYQVLQDDFSVGRNYDQIGRTEDLCFGTRYRMELGWSSPGLGADRSAAILGAGFDRGLRLTESRKLFLSSTLRSRLENGRLRDALLATNARFFWRTSPRTMFYAGLQADAGHALDADHEVRLGGDTGLRGYPLRYQNGSARALFTLEERVYTDWYPMHLFRVGGAVFADVGRTWGASAVNEPNLGLLSDVGVGLRFGSTRSSLANVIHIDLAFPLQREPGIRGVQFVVETRKSF